MSFCSFYTYIHVILNVGMAMENLEFIQTKQYDYGNGIEVKFVQGGRHVSWFNVLFT